VTTQPSRGEFVTMLFNRRDAEGSVFRLDENNLAVFDAELARKINTANYADLDLGDRLIDVVRGRASRPVLWSSVRSTWSTVLRELATAEHHAALDERMTAVIDQRLDEHLNLAWLAQEVITRALVPVVIDGLTPRGSAAVHADMIWKIGHLMQTAELHRKREPVRTVRGMLIGQLRAGMAVRAEISGRARRTRPNHDDLTDPMAGELLDQLGRDRAVDAVTTVLTAIAGPPGAAATSLFYELVNHPRWVARIAAELSEVDDKAFTAAPVGAAPLTARFVKEVLRMWSPPLFLSRVVRTEIPVPDGVLRPGQQYLLSPYMIHHDPRKWPDPDTFDPDRWLPGNCNRRASGAPYLPFGFAPISCIGAGLGMVLLMLLCRLFCTRYRIEPDRPIPPMVLAAVPMPRDFTGRVVRTNR